MYSQHGEDDFIKAMFPPDFKGMVMEIGAYGPVMLSNSRLFIEAGWNAILMEPSPAPLRALVEAYGNNPAVEIYSGAMGDTAGSFDVEPFDISDGPLSTNITAAKKFWEKDGGFFGRLCVPVYPADFFSVISVDFLSIDTEGNSMHVLTAMLACFKTLPKMICVEREDQHVSLLSAVCKDFDYEQVRHEPSAGVNRILRHKEFRP